MRKLFNVLIVVTSVISIVLCIRNLQHSAYNYLFVLPTTYIIIFPFINNLTSSAPNNIITTYMVMILMWLRMVLTPLYGASNDMFMFIGDRTAEDIDTAILLIMYEAIIISITLYLFSNKERKYVNSIVKLDGSPLVYWGLIFVAIVLFFTVGRHMQLFEFGIKTIGEDIDRAGDITDTKLIIVRRIISSGYLFLFMIFIEKMRMKYDEEGKNKYPYYAIGAAILMICIIIGERRTAQLYIAFASCWTLIRLFPSSQKGIVRLISVAAVIVLSLMTIYKQFNAFLYDSYTEALMSTDVEDGLSPQLLDAYLYGVNTVSSNVAYGNIANLNITNLLYDIVRSIFGFSFLVKGDMDLTSEMYNMYIYSGEQKTGLLLSSVGYGYAYFGFVLSPLFTIINIILMILLETKMRLCKSIEMCYIWAYIYMRFAFGFLGSIPPLISNTTQTLFISGGLYWFASKFIKR